MTTQKDRFELTVQNVSRTVENAGVYLRQWGVDKGAYLGKLRLVLAKNPEIRACSLESLKKAVADACQLGLVPDGDEGALVKFGNEAVFIPMVWGLKKIAWEDMGIDVQTGAIWKGDGTRIHRAVGEGGRSSVTQEVTEEFLERGEQELVGAWALGQRRGDAGNYLVVLSRWEIEKTRKVATGSRSRAGPAWQVWAHRMAQKSCANRLFKEMKHLRDGASADRLNRAIAMEGSVPESEEIDMGPIETLEPEPAPVQKRTARKPKPATAAASPQPAPSPPPPPPPVPEDEGTQEDVQASDEDNPPPPAGLGLGEIEDSPFLPSDEL